MKWWGSLDADVDSVRRLAALMSRGYAMMSVFLCVRHVCVCVQRGSCGREGRADQTAVWSNVEHVCGSSPRPLAPVTASLGIIRPAGPRSLYLAFSRLRSEVADPFLSSALPSSYGAFCRNTSGRICAPSSVTIQFEGDPSKSCRILTKIWIMTWFLQRFRFIINVAANSKLWLRASTA